MAYRLTQFVLFPDLLDRPLTVLHDEPATTSDGGSLLLGALDRALGVTKAIASSILETRQPGKIVWRITDTDGDDRLDKAENLIRLGSGGEHGPHAVLPTEDGEGIYFIGGNHI